MGHLKLYEDLFRKDYSDSQIMKAVKIIRDHAESIGKVITKPIGPFESGEYGIVEIIDTPGGPIYVTNRWYKERKRIPQLIHSELVGEWVPKEA